MYILSAGMQTSLDELDRDTGSHSLLQEPGSGGGSETASTGPRSVLIWQPSPMRFVNGKPNKVVLDWLGSFPWADVQLDSGPVIHACWLDIEHLLT